MNRRNFIVDCFIKLGALIAMCWKREAHAEYVPGSFDPSGVETIEFRSRWIWAWSSKTSIRVRAPFDMKVERIELPIKSAADYVIHDVLAEGVPQLSSSDEHGNRKVFTAEIFREGARLTKVDFDVVHKEEFFTLEISPVFEGPIPRRLRGRLIVKRSFRFRASMTGFVVR